jgi:hypothetical protein
LIRAAVEQEKLRCESASIRKMRKELRSEIKGMAKENVGHITNNRDMSAERPNRKPRRQKLKESRNQTSAWA